jgi:ribosome-associated toxin RatA of RatAB toxin-antitoxin module
MSVLTGSCTAVVVEPIERCWALVEDVARAPEWQRTLAALTVLERDDRGRPLICDTVSDAHLAQVHCRVRMSYEPPHRLTWTRVESDDLDALDGSWELEDLGEKGTRVTYALAVDPGRIGIFARPIERLIRPLVIGHQAEELRDALAGLPPP